MNRQKDLYHFRSRRKIKSRTYNYYVDDETGLTIKHRISNYRYIEFPDINHNPLRCYIKTKVGENWENIYSDVMKKIEPRHHFIIKRYIDHYVVNQGYNQDFYPIAPYGRIYENRPFVDYFGNLQLFSKERANNFSKIQCRNKRREEKLKRILNG